MKTCISPVQLKRWGILGLLALIAGSQVGCTDGSDGQPGPTGPVISNISMLGAPIYPGGQVQIMVSAHSVNDGATLSYSWQVPEGWTGNSDSELIVLTAPDAQAEQATVTVQVSDGERESRGSILVATRGPVIESFSVSPLPLEAEATFTVDAYNLDGTVMRTHYDLGGMRVENAGSPWNWQVPTMGMGGLFRLQAIVEDTNGLTANAGVDVAIDGVSTWPGFGGNRQRTGLSTSPNALGAVGNQIWAFATTGSNDVRSSPAIGADGTIYVGSWDKHLYAINPDGTEKWSFETDDIVSSSPTLGADGTIYVGSNDNKVYALNPNGTEKWSFQTGGMVMSSPAIGTDGTIYVGSRDYKIYAINPDGSEKWSFLTDASANAVSSPAIGADGTIYVGAGNQVYALNPNGTKKWAFVTTHGTESSTPAIGMDGTIFIGSNNRKVYALNPDGTEKWSFETDSFVMSSPAIGADGTVYVGSHDNKVYALEPDGTEKWSFQTNDVVISSPAIGADGTVYVGSLDKRLYALNPDGTEKWSFETNDFVSSSPAIGADGTIYVGSWDNHLYAIR